MCRQIPAEFLLANHFCNFPHEPVTFASLRKLRSALESAIDGLVYIDISTPSILSAVEQYPKMFKWDGESVTLASGAEHFLSPEYVESHFDFEVDESIRATALRTVRMK